MIKRYEMEGCGPVYMLEKEDGDYVSYEEAAKLQSERDALAAEVLRYRQAIWDARALMGFDNDGNPTPAALAYPHLADMLLRDAAEFRKDYDQACSEADEVEGLRADAERYRFLASPLPINKQRWDRNGILDQMPHLAKFDLDAAIDAARTTGGEGHE